MSTFDLDSFTAQHKSLDLELLVFSNEKEITINSTFFLSHNHITAFKVVLLSLVCLPFLFTRLLSELLRACNKHIRFLWSCPVSCPIFLHVAVHKEEMEQNQC